MMQNQISPLLNWPYYFQGKTMEELRHTLLFTTLQLETTRLAAQEEIKNRENQLNHLKELLNIAIKDRDEALDKYQKLLLDKHNLQQHQQQQQNEQSVLQVNSSGVSSIDQDDHQPRKATNSSNGFSSSDCCDESIVSSLSEPLPEHALRLISGHRKLPEKGKLLEAVMKAGPILQTLLLAGPLPQWRQPPPPLECLNIPPVSVPTTEINGSSSCGVVDRKRGYIEDGDCSYSFSHSASKYQRVLLH